MARLAAAVLLICSLMVLQSAQTRAAMNVACEAITGITNCVECSGRTKECFLCQYRTVPVWSTAGKITQCKSATTNAVCQKASGDPNCLRCDGVWCVECKYGYYFDSKYRCINAAGNCAKISGNPYCAACNPDGTCTKCRANNPPLKLVALNAIYINAGFPQTKCMSITALNKEAQGITGGNAVIPPNCLEFDTEFKCNRCVDGYSLTGGVCKTLATGSKCSRTLPYGQYCARCNPSNPNQCIQCNGARGLVGGQCRLPCRMLYGIGCKNCNTLTCTSRDANYANGRR